MDSQQENKSSQIYQSFQQYQHINKSLNKLVSFEFLLEQTLNYISNKSTFFNKDRFLEILSLSQFVKVYFKLQKMNISQKQIYISEGNMQEELDEQNRQKSEAFEKFFTEDYIEKYRNLQPEEQIQKMAETLERIKNRQQNGMTFNEDFEEELQRSHKRVGLLSKLPIPKDLLETKQPNQKKSDYMIFVGEVLFIVRPLIYCILLRMFGVKSYTPYMISLIIDLFRLILQRKIKFYQPAQREEFKTRNKEMILNYLLRNPFYSHIFRNKVLIPMLDSLFGSRLQFLKSFILGIIEMRCSICLLL
ncbi:peroxisomal membrane protein (macronuclear) [Tetrahymena thermophila SB210]|uniref:Peroxisomal membrane protein PEX16 n=1 Tax=Tetrahymena thermophila (strain SB210) TaxID=312017 RepID=Q22X13_TETTS|nr:peroxisomal membrane protein [Tetrahymena thermophila SB210]EAR89833.2 peroxisomal membrane protein [Tetrahymena thermophila SB210]|eukprot:XP_001010078.2 peroxisomal membrane protein [Tetrahymena thermophila SB210]